MKQLSDINWIVIEGVAKSVFPTECKMVTDIQLKNMENRISEGLSPVVPDRIPGGVHSEFVGAMQIVGNILQIIAIIQAYYIYKQQQKQRIDCQGFLDNLKNEAEAIHFYTKELNEEIKRTIEKEFDSIISKIDIICKNREE